LFASITETRVGRLSAASNAASAATSTMPSEVTGAISAPGTERSTESCSIAEDDDPRTAGADQRQRVGLAAAAGEDDLGGSTPTSAATSPRACSTARRAARPLRWTEDGLPLSANASATAAITSGRTGVVALWSR